MNSIVLTLLNTLFTVILVALIIGAVLLFITFGYCTICAMRKTIYQSRAETIRKQNYEEFCKLIACKDVEINEVDGTMTFEMESGSKVVAHFNFE